MFIVTFLVNLYNLYFKSIYWDMIKNLIDSIIEYTEFIPVIELLRDFTKLNSENKKELLYYLKVKKSVKVIFTSTDSYTN